MIAATSGLTAQGGACSVLKQAKTNRDRDLAVKRLTVAQPRSGQNASPIDPRTQPLVLLEHGLSLRPCNPFDFNTDSESCQSKPSLEQNLHLAVADWLAYVMRSLVAAAAAAARSLQDQC